MAAGSPCCGRVSCCGLPTRGTAGKPGPGQRPAAPNRMVYRPTTRRAPRAPAMPTVTAVCATPPLPNPGMATVDMALFCLFKRHGLPADLCFVRLYTPAERNPELSRARQREFDWRQALP